MTIDTGHLNLKIECAKECAKVRIGNTPIGVFKCKTKKTVFFFIFINYFLTLHKGFNSDLQCIYMCYLCIFFLDTVFICDL